MGLERRHIYRVGEARFLRRETAKAHRKPGQFAHISRPHLLNSVGKTKLKDIAGDGWEKRFVTNIEIRPCLFLAPVHGITQDIRVCTRKPR